MYCFWNKYQNYLIQKDVSILETVNRAFTNWTLYDFDKRSDDLEDIKKTNSYQITKKFIQHIFKNEFIHISQSPIFFGRYCTKKQQTLWQINNQWKDNFVKFEDIHNQSIYWNNYTVPINITNKLLEFFGCNQLRYYIFLQPYDQFATCLLQSIKQFCCFLLLPHTNFFFYFIALFTVFIQIEFICIKMTMMMMMIKNGIQ